ncbi:ABC transporter ATP-binding protein [Aerococcus urinae]|uniref:ABC transporter ATP-binding protein n=1 Tax=Aerococcus urinae TaxID=1376 RepID=A0A0X8FD23_9LACT|nr:ABC transporter ATP-binding protein [Aerococcus urinae]AMB95072.1 multidrug ABC transporter ATP-binding protein [Aerococcus urinae]MCY3031783.1 ABC transporter ATP-binding protein [Aerococcus urinae]MCY3037223.1 ABC transporter ATP-binding protein [Aerococcus urinae]MCY3043830.1 ABC transporter ATP-binding protein [Aerococcus urinae]MCY3046525.1 ABC transporter ATP-binding protein [Aerococcus urinae]
MIEFCDVHKSYGSKKVLDGINFFFAKNQVTCLIGVNGTGKTTLMKLLMKLTPLDAGKILIDGKPVTTKDFERIIFIPDMPTLDDRQSIRQALDGVKRYYQLYNEERAQELLRFFHLDESDRIANLSKGNVAKVGLLLGLAVDADYMIMDEPFSGIDIFTREEVARVFTDQLMEDRGVLISTHEIQDIESLVDQAILLDQGRIIESFSPEEVRDLEGKSIVDVMREVYGR